MVRFLGGIVEWSGVVKFFGKNCGMVWGGVGIPHQDGVVFETF